MRDRRGGREEGRRVDIFIEKNEKAARSERHCARRTRCRTSLTS